MADAKKKSASSNDEPDWDLDPDPASTYGKPQSYIDQWNAKYNKGGGDEPAPAGDQPVGGVPAGDTGEGDGTGGGAATGTRG